MQGREGGGETHIWGPPACPAVALALQLFHPQIPEAVWGGGGAGESSCLCTPPGAASYQLCWQPPQILG